MLLEDFRFPLFYCKCFVKHRFAKNFNIGCMFKKMAAFSRKSSWSSSSWNLQNHKDSDTVTSIHFILLIFHFQAKFLNGYPFSGIKSNLLNSSALTVNPFILNSNFLISFLICSLVALTFLTNSLLHFLLCSAFHC